MAKPTSGADVGGRTPDPQEAVLDTPSVAAQKRDDATAPTLDPARAPTMDRRGMSVRAGSSDLAFVAPPGAIPDPLKTWDRYEIVRPLGQGGMGTVFLARDRKLGRLVALKFLRVPSADAADRLMQEARAQARLDHNHICKVFEVGEFQGQPYIAMEYIDGQPLHLALRKLSLEQKVLLVQQIALAVHSAHSQGILHRDLKPATLPFLRFRRGIRIRACAGKVGGKPMILYTTRSLLTIPFSNP